MCMNDHWLSSRLQGWQASAAPTGFSQLLHENGLYGLRFNLFFCCGSSIKGEERGHKCLLNVSCRLQPAVCAAAEPLTA